MRITRFALRRPRTTLLVWFLITAALAIDGTQLESHIAPTSITVSGSPSQREQHAAERAGGAKGQAPILLTGPAPEVRAQAERLEAALRRDPRDTVLSSLDPGAPAELTPRGGGAVLLVERPTTEPFGGAVLDAIQPIVSRNVHAPVRASITGFSVIGQAISHESVADAHSAEEIALPVLLLVLLVVFRTPVAAAIPAILGGATVGSALGVCDLVARLGDITDVAPPIASMMGLALGVDYSLLMVSRFREAQRGGASIADATEIASAMAGRTVVVAGGTLLATMAAAMLFAPGSFLLSAAVGAASAGLVAVAAVLTAVPAGLALVGPHVERWRIGRAPRDPAHGRWASFAGALVRRPVALAIPAVAILAALTVPGLGLDTGPPDVRVLPASAPARADTERVLTALGAGWSAPLDVLALGRAPAATLEHLDATLAHDPDVALTLGPKPQGTAAVTTLVPRSGANDPATTALYHRVSRHARALTRATGERVLVGGVAASLADYNQRFHQRLPLLVLALSVVAFLALVLVLRTLILPLIAALLNAAVVGAAFGVLSLVSTGDHPLLGGAGFADALSLLALLALIFGLSLDYQVFILTRLRESWNRTGDASATVTQAVTRTGPVIIGAAMIMSAVFLSFSTAPLQTIRQTGAGLVATVLIAAAALCLTALPVTVRLLGASAFWMPRWLDRALPHIDIESPSTTDAAAPVATTSTGTASPSGLTIWRENGHVHGKLRLGAQDQGARGFAHAGALPQALEQLFTELLSCEAVLQHLELRHHAPTRLARDLSIEVWCEAAHGTTHHLRARISDGKLDVPEARATLLSLRR